MSRENGEVGVGGEKEGGRAGGKGEGGGEKKRINEPEIILPGIRRFFKACKAM